jgi:5'-deoxynucleotidase YfbR-like HD superfamily hydrolase
LFDEYEERETLEGKVAKDADYLEMAFQAKIYVEQGHVVAQDRIDNVVRALKTQGAKQLREEMVVSDSSDWWKKTGLKKM